MAVSDITEYIEVTQNLYSIGNCINSCYSGVDLTGQVGAVAVLTIPQSIYNEIQDGTTMNINGVMFTFITGAPVTSVSFENNIIPLVAQTVLQDYVSVSINENITLDKQLVPSVVANDTILTARECGQSIEVTFTNLTGTLSTQTISDDGVPLTIKERFRISAIYHNALTNEDIGLIETFPDYVLTDDKCEVLSVEACKDISELLTCQLETHLPEITSFPSRYLPNTAIYFSQNFGEKYGVPLNSYGKKVSRTTHKAIKGAWQNGETQLFENFSAHTGNYNPITSYTDGATICKSQPFFFYIDTSSQATNIVVALELFDSTGGQVVAGNPPFLMGDFTGDTVEINLTPDLILDYFVTMFGINPNLVASIGVATSQLQNGTLVSISDQFMINIECCDNTETFIFYSTLGVYETISTRGLNVASMTVLREFIELCEPCTPIRSDRGRKGIATTAYKEFEVFHWDESDAKFNRAVIAELMQSKDVYWIQNGQMYAIETLTNESDLQGNKFSTNDKAFSFRLMAVRN